MSKILIVPDVHGRAFWHRAMELVDQVDKIACVDVRRCFILDTITGQIENA